MLFLRRALVGHLTSMLLEPLAGGADAAKHVAALRGCGVEARPLGVAPAERAADEDRSRAELVLRENFAEGRLSLEELTSRVASLHEARTIGQLRAVLGDLSGDPWGVATVSPAAEDQARIALVVALISVLVPVPPLALGLTAVGLGAKALRAGVGGRRGQALAAVAIGSAIAFVQALALVLWLAGVI